MIAWKINNCPCCGGYADLKTENFGAVVWVQCTECGVQTSRYDVETIVDGKDGKEWAVRTWNRTARFR